MPNVTINGVEIEVDKGTTILHAAAQAGFEVPHFCYHPALSIPANCRMCLVEAEGAPKLLPGCYNAVNDGMIVHTESERVVKARKAVLEFILVNHPVDCPICDKAGECKLQDYYFAYDAQESRMRAEKQHKVKAYPIGPRVVYDGERCILCTRCIRFCEEITGTAELTLIERGDKIEVRAFPGLELDNDYSLCTVDVCPVGALTSRDFRFKCRVWLLTSTDSICTGCATGCNIHLDHFRNETQRYRPRFNPEVNSYWMCDPGRMTYKTLHDNRLLTPRINGAEAKWFTILQDLSERLSGLVKKSGPESIAFVLSPQSSCEDLYLAKRFWERAMKEKSPLFLGGLPEGRGDDFLQDADKNPNSRGVEAVFGDLEGFGSLEDLAGLIDQGQLKGLYIMGGQMPLGAEAYQELVDALDKLDLLIYQGAHHIPELLDKAHFALPVCTHAETEGTFVNREGIAQSFFEAYPPHGASLPDWQVTLRLAQAMGTRRMSFTFLHQVQEAMFEETLKRQEAAEKAQADAAALQVASGPEEAAAKEAASEMGLVTARKQDDDELQSIAEEAIAASEADLDVSTKGGAPGEKLGNDEAPPA